MDASNLKGLLYVLLSSVVGALFAQTYKLRIRWKYPPVPLIIGFAIWYFCISILLAIIFGSWRYSPTLMVLGICSGISFITTVYLYIRVTEKSRLGISWTIIQLSVIVPFCLSLVIFAEHLDIISLLGILLIVLATFLFTVSKVSNDQQRSTADWRLLLMLITSSILTGLNMFIPNVVTRIDLKSTIFSMFPYTGLSMVLLALLSPLIFPTLKAAPIVRRCGKIIGLILFSGFMAASTCSITIFLYYSLKSLVGSIVYPLRNGACLVIVTVLSAVLFRERMTKIELLGIVCSLCGVVLISVCL